MNELELKKLWQVSNDTLDMNLAISKKNTRDISLLKVNHFLGTMKPLKFFAVLVAILWVGIGAFVLSNLFIHAYGEANKFFLFSATAQVVITAFALIIYGYQLILMYQIEIHAPILQTQKKLASLRISTLWVARILFLQLPFWTTFWWNDSMLRDWSVLQWVVTLSITLFFTLLALWLFFNIKYENRKKKWFQLLFNGNEWTPLMKSMELLEQVEEYEQKAKP